MLSPESLLLHASLALIVLAVLAQRPFTLRLLIAAAAAAGLARALLWTHDTITAAWMGMRNTSSGIATSDVPKPDMPRTT